MLPLGGLMIRNLEEQDITPIVAAFAAVGWNNKTTEQYERYLAEQERGAIDVRVAFLAGRFVGYLKIVWKPDYPPYREGNIPEIQDLNVLPDVRRQGIASRLMDEAERIVAEAGYSTIGIGFGMTADYGMAQQMYVRRGYVPDGRGLVSHNRVLEYGDTAIVDDDLVLYLTRELKREESARGDAKKADSSRQNSGILSSS
jgi:GNAT superfamily N-acetyltransferase